MTLQPRMKNTKMNGHGRGSVKDGGKRAGDRTKRVYAAIQHLVTDEDFTADSLEVAGLSKSQVTNALGVLARKGVLVKSKVRGYYCKAEYANYELKQPVATPLDAEVVVIDNLLTAMAAAEPVLKKYKGFIVAIREFAK